MRFQIGNNKFIIQSFTITDNIIKFNIGIIINKIIIYEYCYFNEKTIKITFDNTEFLKKDRFIIQNKIKQNIEEIIKIIKAN